jgi:RNA polymerase sigma factor (sigma-70 family)
MPRKKTVPYDPANLAYLEDQGAKPLDRNTFGQDYNKVVDALEALGEEERRLIERWAWERMPLRDIGKELGCDEATVRRRLKMAMTALETELTK